MVYPETTREMRESVLIGYDKNVDRVKYPATHKHCYGSNGHLEHVSVSSVPLLLSVPGLFTWVCLCLELDNNDGVKND